MNDLFELARLVDLVIAVTLVEGVALVSFRFATGRGLAAGDFLVNMLSGLCLMLALRCVVDGAGSAWVALCLLAAGAAHAADILTRLRRGRPAGRRAAASLGRGSAA